MVVVVVGLDVEHAGLKAEVGVLLLRALGEGRAAQGGSAEQGAG